MDKVYTGDVEAYLHAVAERFGLVDMTPVEKQRLIAVAKQQDAGAKDAALYGAYSPTQVAMGTAWFSRGATPAQGDQTLELRGVVTAVDNSEVISSSVGHLGSQQVTLLVTGGSHKGEVVEADNSLIGSLEIDEMYSPGDTAVIAAWLYQGELQGVFQAWLGKWRFSTPHKIND